MFGEKWPGLSFVYNIRGVSGKVLKPLLAWSLGRDGSAMCAQVGYGVVFAAILLLGAKVEGDVCRGVCSLPGRAGPRKWQAPGNGRTPGRAEPRKWQAEETSMRN